MPVRRDNSHVSRTQTIRTRKRRQTLLPCAKMTGTAQAPLVRLVVDLSYSKSTTSPERVRNVSVCCGLVVQFIFLHACWPTIQQFSRFKNRTAIVNQQYELRQPITCQLESWINKHGQILAYTNTHKTKTELRTNREQNPK